MLKVALERDLLFISQILLDRAVITPPLLSLLLADSQQNMIIEMVTKQDRPTFVSDKQRAAQKRSRLDGESKAKSSAAGGKLGRIARNAQVSLSLAKKIEFVDVVETMIDSPEHSNAEIIEMVRLMQNEMDRVQARK